MKGRRTLAVLAGALALAAGGGRLRGRRQRRQRGGASTTAAAAAATTAATSGARPAPPRQRPSRPPWRAGKRCGPTQRAAIVKRIKDNKWGKSADGKTVTGPEGFKVDLTKCPAGWSETEGLTDTEIKIGQTLPQSGPAADYGNVAKGMSTLFDEYSNKGAFKDSLGKTRKINYIVKDDGYDPARTIPLTDELLDSEHVFAMSTLGSPNT